MEYTAEEKAMVDLADTILKGMEDLVFDPDKPCWECRKKSDAPGRPTKYGWTDEIYLEKGLKYCVWKPIPLNQVEGHLINFVNFWFSGASYSITEVFPMIRNVLLMMPVGTSKELLLKDVFNSAIETAQTPPIVDSGRSVIRKMCVDECKLEHVDTIEAVNFFKWLLKHFNLLKTARKKILEDETYRQVYRHIIHKLRLVLGFCALILIRLMILNEHKIKQFVKCDGTTAFNSLFPEVGFTAKLVPPIWRSLKLASEASKIDRNKLSKNLLQLVVFQYVKSSRNCDASSELTKRILEEGCLKAMQGNGMGLVTMFDDVKRMYTHMDNDSLLPFVADKDPELNGESVKRLVKFMEVYDRGDKPQYSWKWARILSPDYFSDLNIRRNRTFCHKLALLLVETNPCIFEHKDLKHDDDLALFCYHSPIDEDHKKWAQSTLTSLQEQDDKKKLEVSDFETE